MNFKIRALHAVFLLLVFSTAAVYALNESADQIMSADVPFIYGEQKFIERVAERAAGRKPVGLVLSSGSARAFAHIGVLRRMEELGIVPDFIVANSMGSIVGLLYGAGFSPDQISEIFQTADIGSLFKIALPLEGGIIDVGKFTGLLRSFTGDIDVSELPIPVMVICEDLRTKRQVRIAEGDLSTVMQAAYALPAFFNPVEYRDHLLIDGGIANMVPLDIAYKYTDAVIASTAFYQNPNLNLRNPVTNINVAVDIGKSRTGVSQIKKFDPVLIRCDVEEFSFMDFGNLEKIQDAGYRSAFEMSRELTRLDAGGIDEGLKSVRAANRLRMAEAVNAYLPLESISVPFPRALLTGVLNVFPYTGSPVYLNEDLHLTGGLNFSAGRFGATFSAGAGMNLGSFTGIFPVADAALFFDIFPALRIAAGGDLRFSNDSSDYSDPVSAADIFGTSNLYGSVHFVPVATETLRAGLLFTGELGTDESFFPTASVLTLQGEFDASSDPESEMNYTGGFDLGIQLYDDGGGLSMENPSLFAGLDFKLPVPATGGMLRFDGRGLVRYPLDGGSTRYFLRDGMRTSLGSCAGIPSVNISSVELVFNPYGFRPAFAELFIFRDIELSAFGEAGYIGEYLWSSGLSLSLDISLIGVKPFTFDSWLGWDGLSGAVVGGLMIIP